jgi:molybdopterin molybdotransferase
MGALPRRIGIIPDDETRLREAFTSFHSDADCFISSGGVSAGERDMVKRVLRGFGTIDTYRVAMQPGMPQAFGLVEGKPFFGLPGNPVSVFVSFELFIRPALLKMMGRTDLDRPEITAVMDEELAGPPEKTRFFRVEVLPAPEQGSGGWLARPTGPSASNLLGTAVRANGLAVVPAGVATVKPGEEVRVRLFRPPATWAPDPPHPSG